MIHEIAITSLFLILGVACYAYMTFLTFHNPNTSPFKKYTFFGSESWVRKYAKAPDPNGRIVSYNLYAPPDNWYYDVFNIRYKEKFPGSATIFVFVTDAFHLAQWFMIKFFILAMSVRWTEESGVIIHWWAFISLWILWLITFNVTYTNLRK